MTVSHHNHRTQGLAAHAMISSLQLADACEQCIHTTGTQQVTPRLDLPNMLTSLHATYEVCICRYAELNGDNRSFTSEEESLFDRSAEFAYASFRDKAAESRGMPKEELQHHAQGRSA